ncbi:MAG: hypothetical protein NZL87_02085, partial [Thermomicrobium sp.]|nr:hypothetical protein [Thermomicrobium sp.]
LVPGRTLLLLPLAAFLLLAGRNVMLVNTTTTDRPGTILHGEDSSPGLLVAIDRIRRASMDLTVFQLDPRDPTGGHGLAVVLESSVAQPFVWYLRDFPQLTVASVDRLADRAGSAQVVIVSADRHATVASARPELVWQPLPYRLTVPPVLTSPPWGTLAQGVVDPRDWRAYFSFLLYRRVAVDAPPAAVLVGLAPDVAAHAGYPAVP